jgi:nitrogen regulatory protein PII 1
VGRGKQRGIKIGDVTYDELPKEMLMMVIKDEDKDFAVNTIMDAARSKPSPAFGDGKIFISPVEEAYTISRGTKEL